MKRSTKNTKTNTQSKKKSPLQRKLLGHVGVDSGQLIVTDPCYIDSEWTKKDVQDIRLYKHKKTKKLFKYDSPFTLKDLKFKGELFGHYEEKTSTGKNMNQMIQDNEVESVDVPEKLKLIGEFSYAGVCESTMADQNQINYKLGHPGVAVAFSSGYGDGYYPVYGTFNAEGRCVLVEIDCGITETQAEFFAHATKPQRIAKKGSKKDSRK